MPSRIARSAQDCRRQLRLAWRHVRFGHARFCEAGRRARTTALTDLFRGTNAWLCGQGVEAWLDFGTLLGWWRERNIIAHDYDIDFGAPVEAYAVLLAARHRLPPGFALHDTSHRHLGPKLYVAHRGWEADIYFYRTDGPLFRPLVRSATPSERLPFERSWILPLQRTLFLGEETAVPAQAERYLAHLYGYLGRDAVKDARTGYFRPRHTEAPLPSVSDPSSP